MSGRYNVLVALRHWGQPVAPATLARWMNCPPSYVQSSLTALYARDLVDRKPQPMHKTRFFYYAKQVQG